MQWRLLQHKVTTAQRHLHHSYCLDNRPDGSHDNGRGNSQRRIHICVPIVQSHLCERDPIEYCRHSRLIPKHSRSKKEKMTAILIAIAVMMSATIGVHLDLPQAIVSVAGKVCKCPKCLSFWATLATLWLADRTGWAECNIVAAILLSLAMAYLSNWFGILLVWLNHKYTDLWQRLNK